jgi:hypothetical protein
VDESLNIVDIILPVGGNDDFFLLIKGKVVRWAESKSFFYRMYLIKLTICKKLLTLNPFFKELGNDNLLTHFYSLNSVMVEKC